MRLDVFDNDTITPRAIPSFLITGVATCSVG
jgi:hypothetical protein